MLKYLKKTIENEDGGVASAWEGLDLVVNLETRKAHVRERGWKTGQYIADGKEPCVPPVLWIEPDIDILVTVAEYPILTPIEKVIFDCIVTRMITLDYYPGTETPNPFKGAVVTDVPEPTPEEDPE